MTTRERCAVCDFPLARRDDYKTYRGIEEDDDLRVAHIKKKGGRK